MRELGPNDKGAIAEAEIRAAALRAGVGVYHPVSGHSRADLIFEKGDGLWRVQVKWARLSPTGDYLVGALKGTRLSPKGYVITTYAEDEIDLFALYCGDLDRSFLLPSSLCAGVHSIQLRLTPPRNNQRACINLAETYEFAGAVAQLGERRAGSAKVRGSSPLSSTRRPDGPVTVGSNPFRDRLGYWMDRVAAGEEVIITRRGKPRFRMSPVSETGEPRAA